MARSLRPILILFLPFFFVFLGFQEGSGQCSPSVPSSANVVTNLTLHGSSGESVWVCQDATVSLQSAFGSVDNVVVYAEENSVVNVENDGGADGNTVYAKGGVTINVGSNASNTTVNKVSSATVIDQGTGTSTNSCGSLNFDYSNAPQNGCQPTSIEESSGTLASNIKVHSVRDRIRIAMPKELLNSSEPVRVSIFDMQGKEVFFKNLDRNEATLNPDLPTGIYHFALRKEGELLDSGKLRLR